MTNTWTIKRIPIAIAIPNPNSIQIQGHWVSERVSQSQGDNEGVRRLKCLYYFTYNDSRTVAIKMEKNVNDGRARCGSLAAIQNLDRIKYTYSTVKCQKSSTRHLCYIMIKIQGYLRHSNDCHRRKSLRARAHLSTTAAVAAVAAF